jgi:hypothetical protein
MESQRCFTGRTLPRKHDGFLIHDVKNFLIRAGIRPEDE